MASGARKIGALVTGAVVATVFVKVLERFSKKALPVSSSAAPRSATKPAFTPSTLPLKPVPSALPRKTMSTTSPVDQTSTGGLLLASVQAGTNDAPAWVGIPLGDMTVTVAADNLRAAVLGAVGALRLPVSWTETIAMAKALGSALGEDIIVPSQKIADAIYAAAKVKTQLHGQGTAAMGALGTVKRYNADIDTQIAAKGGVAGDVVSGHEKYWLLHERLDPAVNDASLRASNLPSPGPNPAVNYGGWDANGKTIQTIGGRHNASHWDYSQLFRPVKRWATKSDGTKVDLLAWIEANEKVAPVYTDLFRAQVVA